jgi:large subunit ribosomal protein L1
MKRSKRYTEALSQVDRSKKYPIDEALDLLKKIGKDGETVEVALKLGIDPRKPEQMVRGTAILPHGLGKEKKVMVFAKGDRQQEAFDAGASVVGAEELVKRIKDGELPDVDIVVATPDMMGAISSIGKILGRRGLMPNPKLGTVTYDIKDVVDDAKTRRVDFRSDRGGCTHAPCGLVSFDKDALKENIKALVKAIESAKPPSSRGVYIKSLTISATFSPGIKVDVNSLKEKR